MPPVIAIAASIAASVAAATAAVGTAVFGAVAWTSIAAFLASPIGALVLGVGLSFAATLFAPSNRRATPSMDAGKVDVRVPEPERWLHAGICRSGGGVVFAEFDPGGNFWFVVVNSDSVLAQLIGFYFDDTLISWDVNHNVTTDDFCLDNKGNTYGGGIKIPYFNVRAHTYTQGNPVPEFAAELQAAFPTKWNTDHKLVGTTYTVVKISAISAANRYKIYKWRGPVGVGEPAVSVLGLWSYMYDPRDPAQVLGNPSTYGLSKNSVIIWAWFRTHRYGRNKSTDSINWARIAEQADICDQIVNGVNGSQRRYECGISIPESTERSVAEQSILAACDGQIVFDDDGKSWCRAGYYYMPTLNLTRNRDIVEMESVEAQDGESETQGVIVRWTDPASNYTAQPSAPWLNPNYYVAGTAPKYLTFDALAIQNQNQALRLAKSIGMRSQPIYKILPTVGLRGLKARQERIISLQYDNVFAGDHEIVTPIEVDENGQFCGLGLVPVDPDRWNLLSGEETSVAVPQSSYNSYPPTLPTGVVLSFVNGSIQAQFDAPIRADDTYLFQFLLSTSDPANDAWSDMSVDMVNRVAMSGTVPTNVDYYVRWKTVSSSGRSTDYITPIPTVDTTIVNVSGTPITTATHGSAYSSFTVHASGGATPYYFVDLYSRLPPGIVINSSTGVVSGTPTTAGSYANIIIRVQDANSAFNTLTAFTITVA